MIGEELNLFKNNCISYRHKCWGSIYDENTTFRSEKNNEIKHQKMKKIVLTNKNELWYSLKALPQREKKFLKKLTKSC